jgi:branched-chain amino acid transport system permease protein
MRRTLTIASIVVGIALMAILPQFLTSYYLGLVVLMLIWGIFAMSLDLLLGYGGLPSLGQAAFFGSAAYAVAFLALNVANNFVVNVGVGLGLALALAAAFGLLVLRTRGVYFLMITLALSQVLWGLAFKWRSVTGGDDGLPGIPRPALGSWELTGTADFYYLALGIFLIALVLLLLITRSPFGRALVGIRESESRMEALGYNVWLYQYVTFILAGFFAGLAGTISAYYHGLVGPAELHIITSAKVLLMVILGGAGTLIGPVLGAAIIVFLENFLSGYTERWLFILGTIYVLVILFAPRGLYGPIRERLRQWTLR